MVSLTEITEEIRRVFREAIDLELVGDPHLDTLELDSLARLTVAVALEDRFLVILSDVDVAEVPRLSDLARAIAARGGVP